MQQQKTVTNKKVFFSIEELVQELNVKKFLVKSWEKDFKLKPDHPAGGNKCYSYENLKTFATIKDLLLNKKMTLSQAKQIISTRVVEQENKVADQVESQSMQTDSANLAVEVAPAVQSQPVEVSTPVAMKDEVMAAPVSEPAPEDHVQPAVRPQATVEVGEKIETKEVFLQKVLTLKEQLIQFKQLLDLD
jgi:DNA-binding transcriptional MerR regulator